MPWRKGNRLRLVNLEEADETTRRILQDIAGALAVPKLELFYPALAVYPAFLRLHWELVRAVIGSRQLFDIADRLRAEAYTRSHNYFQVPDLSTHNKRTQPDGEASGLAAIADFYHYLEPLLLLVFCYQMQALEGPTGNPATRAIPHTPSEDLHVLPAAVPDASRSPSLKKRLEEVRRVLATPFVNPEYCAFMVWPGFFDAYWESLKQMMASPVYDECRYGVRSTAWSFAAGLPGTTELSASQLADAGMSPDEIASVARILELFVQNLSGQLLNVAAAKIALEGGNLVVKDSYVVSRRKRKTPAA